MNHSIIISAYGITYCPIGSLLHRLDLHDNPLTAEVAAPLARVVAAHPQLRVLDLNDTSLTDQGVAVLAQALATGARDLQVRRTTRG